MSFSNQKPQTNTYYSKPVKFVRFVILLCTTVWLWVEDCNVSATTRFPMSHKMSHVERMLQSSVNGKFLFLFLWEFPSPHLSSPPFPDPLLNWPEFLNKHNHTVETGDIMTFWKANIVKFYSIASTRPNLGHDLRHYNQYCQEGNHQTTTKTFHCTCITVYNRII